MANEVNSKEMPMWKRGGRGRRQSETDKANSKAQRARSHGQQTMKDQGVAAETFAMAGPRSEIAFDPKECRAAIVTCGGLCSGLNTVVKEVVMYRRRQYGVAETYGVRVGYRGFLTPKDWMRLDKDAMRNLHVHGGSVLGSSQAIIGTLAERGVKIGSSW